MVCNSTILHGNFKHLWERLHDPGLPVLSHCAYAKRLNATLDRVLVTAKHGRSSCAITVMCRFQNLCWQRVTLMSLRIWRRTLETTSRKSVQYFDGLRHWICRCYRIAPPNCQNLALRWTTCSKSTGAWATTPILSCKWPGMYELLTTRFELSSSIKMWRSYAPAKVHQRQSLFIWHPVGACRCVSSVQLRL